MSAKSSLDGRDSLNRVHWTDFELDPIVAVERQQVVRLGVAVVLAGLGNASLSGPVLFLARAGVRIVMTGPYHDAGYMLDIVRSEPSSRRVRTVDAGEQF